VASESSLSSYRVFQTYQNKLFHSWDIECQSYIHGFSMISIRNHFNKQIETQRALGSADSALDIDDLIGDDHLLFGGCVTSSLQDLQFTKKELSQK
jgi:hypothetical protein